MDMSFIAGIGTAITAAIDLSKAAAGLRDSALIATEVVRINEQLLQAQQALLRHNSELLTITQEHFQAREELRVAREALNEKGRYALVEIAAGKFAYRVNTTPQERGAGEPGGAEPAHYVCQYCFDRGVKAVLQRFESMYGTPSYDCPSCELSLAVGKATPLPSGGGYAPA